MAPRSSKAAKEKLGVPSRLHESNVKPDETARKEILRALEKWLADDSGYDEKVWPQLKKAIEENRLSSRKRFRD